LPQKLTDLSVVRENKVRVEEGVPVDQWRFRIHYEPGDGTYKLYSNGRDDKPGGVGDYADLYAGQPDPAEGKPPTFGQFLTEPKTINLQAACMVSGVVAFPLCLLQAAGKGGKRPTLGQVILTNAVTAFFAILAAVMIGTLHIVPGGH